MAKSVDSLFFKFIEEAEKLGEQAHYEQSHSNGVSDKDSAVDAIKEYGDLLKTLNDKFEKFKSASSEAYGIKY